MSRYEERDMKIGIIGAGHIGHALAALAKAHGDVAMLSNSRGPHTLVSTQATIGCEVGTLEQAAAFGDVTVLAVPFFSVAELPRTLLEGRILIDTCNYYPDRDTHIAALDARETTTSEMVAAHFPGARVVKAFNAILAADIETTGTPTGTPGRRALPVAGDDAAAKAVVIGLLGRYGFDSVDTGPLAQSWRFERAKPAYCVPFDRAGMERAIAQARRDEEVEHGSWRHGASRVSA
jgi:8-hydroxy-5-deazaflavin:NADPH oxidoreductase